MTTPPLNGIGFKAIKSDLTSHEHFKYDIGQIYVHTGPLELWCKGPTNMWCKGFQLCKQLHQTFNFYDPNASIGNRYFVVSFDDTTGNCDEIAGGETSTIPYMVTSAIRLEAEIEVGEHLEISDMVKQYPSEHMLLYLARYGNSPYVKKVFKQLLEAGADVHSENDYALRGASKNGHHDVVKMLLEHGADVHARDNVALRDASVRGHTEIVKLLLDNEADVHADDDAALIWACEWGRTEIIKLLLDYGANVHTRDDWALRCASGRDRTETDKLLLEAGVDTDRTLLWSSGEEFMKTVQLLLNRGADVHADDDHALRWASETGNTNIVQLLLEAGADVHSKNDQALQNAIQNGHTEVVKLLRDASS